MAPPQLSLAGRSTLEGGSPTRRRKWVGPDKARPGRGVVFGPRPRYWSIKINRKEKRLAISTAMASAAVNTIVVEDFSDDFEKLEKPKTTEFIVAMKRWGIDLKEKTTFFMLEVAEKVKCLSRNIGTLS